MHLPIPPPPYTHTYTPHLTFPSPVPPAATKPVSLYTSFAIHSCTIHHCLYNFLACPSLSLISISLQRSPFFISISFPLFLMFFPYLLISLSECSPFFTSIFLSFPFFPIPLPYLALSYPSSLASVHHSLDTNLPSSSLSHMLLSRLLFQIPSDSRRFLLGFE